MEQLINEISAYARQTQQTPQRILRAAIGAGWGTWSAWLEGVATPTLRTVDRVRQYMAENPPVDTSEPQPVGETS